MREKMFKFFFPIILITLGACQSPDVTVFINVDNESTLTIGDVDFNTTKKIDAKTDMKIPLPLP